MTVKLEEVQEQAEVDEDDVQGETVRQKRGTGSLKGETQRESAPTVDY